VDFETVTQLVRSWNERKERLFTEVHVRRAAERLTELGWLAAQF
jgi:hypothetical protein